MRLGIGSRETYIPALKDHSIDLVPEYIGNLLLYFDPHATVTLLDAVELELYRRLPAICRFSRRRRLRIPTRSPSPVRPPASGT